MRINFNSNGTLLINIRSLTRHSHTGAVCQEKMRPKSHSTLKITDNKMALPTKTPFHHHGFKNSRKINLRSSVQLPNRKHCKDDEACSHCCQCWLKHQEEYKQRLQTHKKQIERQVSEIDLLRKCLEKRNLQYTKLKSKFQSTTDIDFIREQIRRELEGKIDSDLKFKMLVLEQKNASLKKSFQTQQKQFEAFQSEREQLEAEVKRLKSQVGDLEVKSLQLERTVKEGKKVSKALEEAELQVNDLTDRNAALSIQVSEKTSLIQKLNQAIKQSQQVLNAKTQQHESVSAEKQVLRIQGKGKDSLIQQMTEASIHNQESFDLVYKEKRGLDTLVQSLVGEIRQKDKYQLFLNGALDGAEQIAREKTRSLEALKADVDLLRYTL